MKIGLDYRLNGLIKIIHDVINNSTNSDQKIINYGIEYHNQNQKFALVKTCKIITTTHENGKMTHEEEDHFFLVDLEHKLKKEITEIGYNRNYEVFFFEKERMFIALNPYQTVFGHYKDEISEIKIHYETCGNRLRPARRPVFSSFDENFVLVQTSENTMLVYSIKDRDKISVVVKLEDDGDITFVNDFKIVHEKDFLVCAVVIQHETTACLRKRIGIFVSKIGELIELKNSVIIQKELSYLNIFIDDEYKIYSVRYGDEQATYNISSDLD